MRSHAHALPGHAAAPLQRPLVPGSRAWPRAYPRARNQESVVYARMHIKLPTPRAGAVGPRGAAVAIAAAACAALISACGSSSSSTTGGATTTVDTARVALSIEQTVLNKRKLHVKVVCPTSVPAEVGKTFECLATPTGATGATKSTPFVVTVQNNRGYVTYVGK